MTGKHFSCLYVAAQRANKKSSNNVTYKSEIQRAYGKLCPMAKIAISADIRGNQAEK